MFIRSLALRNVLSFREPQPLELRPLNILIGPNGSGKSNLIACIELLQAAPNSLVNYINGRGGTALWVWKGPKGTSDGARVACEFDLDGKALNYEIEFGEVERSLVIHSESLATPQYAYITRQGTSLQIGTAGALGQGDRQTDIGPGESVLAAYRNPQDPTPITRCARSLGNIRVYRGFQTGESADARYGVASSLPKHPLNPTGSNLALLLQEMDFHGSLEKVKRYLRRLSDRFEDIKIRPEGARSQLYVQERGIGMLSASHLSDGTLRFLCLMAVLFDPNPAPLVCIEEPEAGLHPEAISQVADALREASCRMQLVVTTHSEALVDRFGDEPDRIVVCDRDSCESTGFMRLSKEQLHDWLGEYTLGDLWRRGEIGGTQR